MAKLPFAPASVLADLDKERNSGENASDVPESASAVAGDIGGAPGKFGNVTNAEFLDAIFGSLAPGEYLWTTSFSGDPASAGGKWGGEARNDSGDVKHETKHNTYFSVATVRDKSARTKENLGRVACVVLDDSVYEGEVSWRLQTSAKKGQTGFILDVGVSDVEVAERLGAALNKSGWCDRVGANPVRYARLPQGTNSKPEHGKPFRHVLHEWNPKRVFTLDEVIEVLSLDRDEIINGKSYQGQSEPVTGDGFKISEGGRNAQLTSLAGTIRRGTGASEAELLAFLKTVNQTRCTPPLDESEIRTIAHSVSKYPTSYIPDTFVWSTPVPFKTVLHLVPEADRSMFPASIWEWSEDVAHRMQCPIEIPLVSIISCVSALIGIRIKIRPKQRDSWATGVNLWGIVIGHSGILKSPPMKAAVSFLRSIEEQDEEQKAKSAESEQSTRRLKEQKIKALKREAERLVNDSITPPKKDQAPVDNSEKVIGLYDQISQLEKEVAEAAAPVRLVINDATSQAVQTVMKDHPGGILLHSDELVGWIDGMESSHQAGARQFFLQTFDANGRLDVDRVERGHTKLVPCLAVLGGIQPGVMAALLQSVLNNGTGNDGMIQRFSLMVRPDLPPGFKYVDQAPSPEAMMMMREVFTELADTLLGEQKTRELYFDGKAQARFEEWYTSLRERLIGMRDGPLTSHFSKYAKLVPALALIFHMVDPKERYANQVGVVSLNQAIEFSKLLEAHAYRVYFESRSANLAAEILLKKLIERDLMEFRQKEITDRNFSKHGSTDLVVRSLVALEKHGYVRRLPVVSENGRPSIRWQLNPIAVALAHEAEQNGGEDILGG